MPVPRTGRFFSKLKFQKDYRESLGMNIACTVESEVEESVDAIEEIRLRTWARMNYTPSSDREENWHPIIHDEMIRIDRES